MSSPSSMLSGGRICKVTRHGTAWKWIGAKTDIHACLVDAAHTVREAGFM